MVALLWEALGPLQKERRETVGKPKAAAPAAGLATWDWDNPERIREMTARPGRETTGKGLQEDPALDLRKFLVFLEPLGCQGPPTRTTSASCYGD